MSEKKVKEVKITVVDYITYTDYSFIEPATYFCMDSMQNYVYFHTSDRSEAQRACNERYGENFYTVKTSKTIKTKSSREDGGYSAYGSNSRKGFASQLKKTQ
jgi:hypothetical protein